MGGYTDGAESEDTTNQWEAKATGDYRRPHPGVESEDTNTNA